MPRDLDNPLSSLASNVTEVKHVKGSDLFERKPEDVKLKEKLSSINQTISEMQAILDRLKVQLRNM